MMNIEANADGDADHDGPADCKDDSSSAPPPKRTRSSASDSGSKYLGYLGSVFKTASTDHIPRRTRYFWNDPNSGQTSDSDSDSNNAVSTSPCAFIEDSNDGSCLASGGAEACSDIDVEDKVREHDTDERSDCDDDIDVKNKVREHDTDERSDCDDNLRRCGVPKRARPSDYVHYTNDESSEPDEVFWDEVGQVTSLFGEVLEHRLDVMSGPEDCILNLAAPNVGDRDLVIEETFDSEGEENGEPIQDVHPAINEPVADEMVANNDALHQEELEDFPGVHLEGDDLDRPLYGNAEVSLKDALVAILAYVISEGTTSTGLDSLLKLLSALLPGDSILPDTKYLFNKVFDGSFGTHQYKLYCPHCENLVNVDPNDANIYNCESCDEQHQKTKLMDSGNFFIHLPIAPQLGRLFQRSDIGPKLSYRFQREKEHADSFSDIYDGAKYKSMAGGALLTDQNATSLTFSTDGLPLFHSSNYSVWPLTAIVNELPPKLREENVLLLGIWFGPQKPHMNVFLEPFVQEMTSLAETGLKWRNNVHDVISSRVYACTFPCDSVARCQLQNIKQFNGEYGCSWCLHPGRVMEKGNGHVRCYPYLDGIDQRTDTALRDDAADAVVHDEPVHGVKGPSVLMELEPEFDMVNGFVVDNLHCVDLGVTRQLANLWFDSSNNQNGWYVGTRVAEIDKRLSLIHPPYEVTRLPRSLTQRKYWKGSEWHVWLMQYSIPVLKEILPMKYLKHLGLLVEGVYLLSHLDEIKLEDLERADACLNLFVSNFSTLYGEENVTYNIHQLLHLADSVKNWGPLWAYSTYIFEGYFQKILKMFHGTQAVPVQIVNRFNLWRNLMSISEDIFSADNANLQIRSFLKERLYGLASLKHVTRIDHVTLVGRGIRRALDVEETFVIERLLRTRVNINVVAYKKVICNGLRAGSTSGQLARSIRQNHTVVTRQKTVVQISEYLSVRRLDGGDMVCIALGHPVTLGNRMLEIQCVRDYCSQIREYEVRGAKVAYNVWDIYSKCSIIDAANGLPKPICCLHSRHQLTT